jgi:hypothetical protein
MNATEAVYRKRIKALDEETDRLIDQADVITRGLKAIITRDWKDGDWVVATSLLTRTGRKEDDFVYVGQYRSTPDVEYVAFEDGQFLYVGSWTFELDPAVAVG